MAELPLSNVPTLETARLALRTPVLADADAITALVGDWEVAKWLGRVTHPYVRDDAVFYITNLVPKEHIWAVCLRDTNAYIGSIGLSTHRAGDDLELGYWIGMPHWGEGYITEAARAVVDYAFSALECDHLISNYILNNAPSGNVLKKLGFIPTEQGTVWSVSNKCDMPVMNMILERGDWLIRHNP